jgi:hypothetical protein
VRKILTHIGEPATPPPISPARGPPEWYEDSGEVAIGVEDETRDDSLAQSEPEYELDQRLSWWRPEVGCQASRCLSMARSPFSLRSAPYASQDSILDPDDRLRLSILGAKMGGSFA